MKIKVTEEMKHQAHIESQKRDAYITHHFEVPHFTKEERDTLGFCGEFATCSAFGLNWKDNIRDNYYTIDDYDLRINGNKLDVKTETVPSKYAMQILNRTINDDAIYGRRLIHTNQYELLKKYDVVIFGLFIRDQLDYFHLLGYVETSQILGSYPPTLTRPDGGQYPFAASPIPTSLLKPIDQLLIQTTSTMKFRDYQLEIIKLGSTILLKQGLVYLAMEVRTGKTLTSLGICSEVNASNVLFITKKRAIPSIEADYKMLGKDFNLRVINYESLHKLPDDGPYDIIICDEAHCMGAFAVASKRAKQVKSLLQSHGSSLILLSGTPTPESFSQIYHQVWGHPNNPFSGYKNFYGWAKHYVDITQKRIRGNWVNDYSKGKESEILDAMEPYMISYTQKQAGWQTMIDEEVVVCDLNPMTHKVCKLLKRDKVVQGKGDVILADTGVKLMNKLHQLYSGTIICESGDALVLDYSKAEYIAKKFWDEKIAIFYKFKAELTALKEVFGETHLTTDLEEFQNPECTKSIALQIVSGREGISLKEADYLVYYNIDFSATSYWQSRDRMSTKTRVNNKIYWVFSDGGIEEKIYKVVNSKKNYTLKHFTDDLNKFY